MGRISMPQGKGSQLHNRREYENIGREIPDNIDTSKSNQNIVLVDKDLRQAYEEIFGEALAEYNVRQKRADRKIDSYYDHIQKSKNGEKLFYEDVLQWGKKEDFENPQTREKAKETLRQYASTFEQRNPNLRLVGAYIHMDEASPHLHLDYVPVAHGYKRGLSTRNALDNAMKQMGYVPEKESRKNNATKLWKENERAYFGELCRNMGLEVEAERKARGSLSVEEYKEARDEMLEEIEQEYAEKKAKVESMDEIASYIASDGQNDIKAENYTIEAKKSILGQIREPERVGVFVENMNKGQMESLVQRVKADEKIEATLERTRIQCRNMIGKAKEEAKEIKAEATAERNETIAKAEQITRQEQSILARAKEFAENLKKQYQELANKVREILSRKERLEQEVAQIEAYKGEIEPLRQEVQELSRAKKILSGELDNELTQARFKTTSEMREDRGFGNDITFRLRDEGKLIALYTDGRQRIVGRNEHGGLDNRTLEDQKNGLCRIGAFVEEERVKVPKSLLKELIQNRDRTKTISQSLQNLIQQQSDVAKVISREKPRTR